MRKRGQVSMELLLTVGFALLMIIPLSFLFYDYTQRTTEEVYNKQALTIARKLVDSADEVFYLGHPTSVTLKLNMPRDLKNISTRGNELVLTSNSGVEAIAVAKVNLTSNLTGSSGLRYIRIGAYQNVVNLTDVQK